MENNNLYYEKRLQYEIEAIEIKIKELTIEKQALQRQLMKARQVNTELRDVNRRNSVDRIMIENKVIEILSKAKKPMQTEALYKEAQHVNFELKKNTFRVCLHRMKNKDLIKTSTGNGRWIINNPS